MTAFSSAESLIQEWHRRFGTRIGQLALFHLGRTADAEDIVQQVFLDTLEHLRRHGVDSVAKPQAYLQRVTRNACMDHLARRKRTNEVADPSALEQFEARPEAAAGESEAVLNATRSLSAAQREIVLMKVFQEFTLEEIADITGAPLGTVRSHYRRALQTLRETLPTDTDQDRP